MAPGVLISASVAASVSIMCAGWITFARPKSITLVCPRGVMMTFEGLMSRWMIPRACASVSASATCVAMASDSFNFIDLRLSFRSSVSPSTYCIIMKLRPSASPTS